MNKKELRRNFRETVLKRDGYKCRGCGDTESRLDAHHISDRKIMPNGGYVVENGIALCDKEYGCHWKAEVYHSSGHQSYIEGFRPDELYSLIGSSLEIATEKSNEL